MSARQSSAAIAFGVGPRRVALTTLSEREVHARVHSAITHLIHVEQELEDIPGARPHELQAARLRHSLYSLLGLGPCGGVADGDAGAVSDPTPVDLVVRRLGDGTIHDPLDCLAPLLGDGGVDPTDITRDPADPVEEDAVEDLLGYEYHEG